MEDRLSMSSRVEITKKYALEYSRAPKKTKGAILDTVTEITGWNRDHARRQLVNRLRQPPGRATATIAVIDRRRTKARKYSYDAVVLLQRVWALSGGQCGKYLAASMPDLLESLQAHHVLEDGKGRCCAQVRVELEQMSAATIDRYLKPARARDPIRGRSTTRPGQLLRNSITIRKATDEAEAEPGFFEGDAVAHCGPTLQGQFIRTLNLTDVHTGWTCTRSIPNNAHVHVLAGLDYAVAAVPYEIAGLDFDNGSESVNHDVVNWAADRQVFFTRSRPCQKNDQATIESKNNHLVRRYGFYYRYDTPAELRCLNELWALVNDRLNYFTPTKKPTGWSTDAKGRRKRIYDAPATPYQRLLRSRTLGTAQLQELARRKKGIDLANTATQIDRCQQRLIMMAAGKTRKLQETTSIKVPDRSGIKIRKKSS